MPGFPLDKSSDSTQSKLLIVAEDYLMERIKKGFKRSAFLLGQLYFEENWYDEALTLLTRNLDRDYQALCQAGVMYYSGLGTPVDHKRGVVYMLRLVHSTSPDADQLKDTAAYNLGHACYHGFGMRRSEKKAEKWLIAANNGNPKAQSVLGMLYSDRAQRYMKRSLFWHSEACGNGNLESQGALGKGVKKSLEKAEECLKEAAEQGNVYAHGQMVGFYYCHKMYTLAFELAKQVVLYEEDIDNIATTTECLPEFITKGISMANFCLARCLEHGLGVQQDPAAAKKYYIKSHCLDRELAFDLYVDLYVISGKI